MILDNTIRLEAVLAGAVSSNQPEFHVDYTTWNVQGVTTKPSPARGALNSNTDVTILASPTTQGEVREIHRVSIYNKDTATETVTIKTDDGTTERIVAKATLLTLETLLYEKGQGFYVLTASGGFKQGALSGPTSSTNNSLVRWDGATGTAIKDTTDMTYDGTTYVIGANKFTVIAASGNTLVAGTFGVTGHTTFEGVTSTGATGTGNIVYSASPTFSGTATIPTGFIGARSQLTGTDRVSVTGATTIFNLALSGSSVGATGALVFVNGYKTTDSSKSFVDLVLFITGISPVVVTGGSVNRNTPDTRTYSASGGSLQLAMGANTYNVTTSTFEGAS